MPKQNGGVGAASANFADKLLVEVTMVCAIS